MKRKGKVVVSMLAVASTLALGVLGSCAGIDKISQKIKEKKCDHEEYQFVEVTEEATCVLEGERLLECVECGKTKTEKFLLQHVDEDGDGTCDICDAPTIELVEVEVGELVVGNKYRCYRGESSIEGFILSNDVQFCMPSLGSDSLSYVFKSGPLYQLEGLEVFIADDYVDIYFEKGTYAYVKTNSGVVDDSISAVVIDETTSIKSVVTDKPFYRVIPIV